MLKVLFKKQVTELISNMLGGKSLKKNLFSTRVLLSLLLGFYLFILMFRLFWSTASSICQPLCEVGNDWMYFALMAIMATFIGVTGSLFTANSTIYHARDNELLLSLPIPQWMIVFVRMAMIYLVSAAFEIMVMLPTILIYIVVKWPPIWALLFQVVGVLALPVIAVAVSCLIGWISAVVNSKIRQRAIFSVITSLCFIGIFYYVYWNLYTYLQLIIANADTVGGTMKVFLYPFYQFGRAAEGSIFSFIIYIVLMAVILLLVVKLISGNFVELAAKTQVVNGKKVKKKPGKKASPAMALYKKEMRRFTSSSVSMLSCAMGSIMMAAIGVMCFFAGDWIIMTFMGMTDGATAEFPLMAVGIIAMMIAMNTIAATSISLEGKYIWMLKVLPISPWQVFKAKLGVHVTITAVPAVFCAAAFAVAGHVDIVNMLLMMFACLVFSIFCGLLGLLCNLRFPNLTWTNEAQAVKQNMSVIIATFLPWGVLIVLALLCFVMRAMGDEVSRCLISAIALVGSICFFMAGRLVKRGSERFMEL